MFFSSFWGWVTWGWDAESPLASVGGISFAEAGGMIVQLAKESFYLMNGGVSRFFFFFLEIFRKQNQPYRRLESRVAPSNCRLNRIYWINRIGFLDLLNPIQSR